MSNLNLHTITNSFLDVRLISLASWHQASQISPRDHGGPYVVLQEGYDPDDVKMIPNEFVLGRSGQWLALGHFFKLPVDERRAEFVFGTAGEVMQMMSNLASKVQMFGRAPEPEGTPAEAEDDDMTIAFKTARNKGRATS
jgi:hypothetical protein